jgi:Family of unknown function (DUF695)
MTIENSLPALPKPHYTLIETSRGEHPAIVVINSALRRFAGRPLFPWHLKLDIKCQLLADNGMPTAEETRILYEFEDRVSALLEARQNVIFLSRVTCQGTRELSYRVHDPKAANDNLQQLLAESDPIREWEYRMEEDPSWQLAKAELGLIERDPKYS